MKKIVKLSLVALLGLGTGLQAGSLEDKIKALEEEISYLHERADENELQAGLSKIKWSGEMETSVSNYKGQYTDFSSGMPVNKDFSNNKINSKLKLKMNAQIADNLKFTGRLAMDKNWGDSTKDRMLQDSTYGRRDGTASLYVDRAYVDYRISDKVVVTIGRQPATDGPGMNLIEDTPRKATYPSLLFNGATDGVVLSYNIGDKKVAKELALRLAYGKAYQSDHATTDAGDLKDTNIAGLFLEGKLPVDSMGDNLFVLSYVMAKNFIGSGLMDTNSSSPSFGLSNPGNNLGDGSVAGVYFENNKAFGTKLSYFVSAGISKLESNGKTTSLMGQTMQLLDDSGKAVHVGLRYDFKKDFKVGYEYNKGSKYWFNFTSGSTDPLNKLSTRGNVHDIYVTKNLDMYQTLRLGFTKISYDYGMSGYHVAPGGNAGIMDLSNFNNDETKRMYLTYNLKF
jgi:hypothetical protein